MRLAQRGEQDLGRRGSARAWGTEFRFLMEYRWPYLNPVLSPEWLSTCTCFNYRAWFWDICLFYCNRIGIGIEASQRSYWHTGSRKEVGEMASKPVHIIAIFTPPKENVEKVWSLGLWSSSSSPFSLFFPIDMCLLLMVDSYWGCGLELRSNCWGKADEAQFAETLGNFSAWVKENEPDTTEYDLRKEINSKTGVVSLFFIETCVFLFFVCYLACRRSCCMRNCASATLQSWSHQFSHYWLPWSVV